MVQTGTTVEVLDNSGAKYASCIKIITGFKKRYAKNGDIILVSIKEIRNIRRILIKVKKGEMYKALIIRSKTNQRLFSGEFLCLYENSVILLNKHFKMVGTRIFGSLPKLFRFTKFFKIIALSSGISF